MKKYLPFLEWLPKYNKSSFNGDLIAGLTVGVMLIPQGMAYSMLAGLPPIYGLYAATIPLIIYALLGTSRQLAVGPVAMVALLIASGVGNVSTIGSPEFIAYAIVLALMVGIIQLTMGIFKLGFLVNFLAHPVIAGFTSAAAIIIGLNQLKHLFGISIPRGKVHEILMHLFENISQTNWPTLAIGIGSVLILFLVKRINKKIPGPLIVVVLSISVVYFGQFYDEGVKIVKHVPDGLPGFQIPSFNIEAIMSMLPIALTISFVGFMESIAVAKAIQAKHKDYQVVPNQELIALGMSNIVGSLFSSFPVTGGFSRTAVNDQAGAKTGMASMISAFVIIITLLFFTSYFYYLPNAVLAAIIMVAVIGLVDIKEAKHLWKVDRKDFTVFIITALATLILGIEEGILVGVVLSIGLLIYKVSYPHIAELGRVPENNVYRNVNRFDNLETFSDILILRFDAQLYFANAEALKNYVQQKISEREAIKYVIIEASAISSVDSSAIHMLHDLEQYLEDRDISLCLSSVKGPVRDVFKQNKILQESDDSIHYFLTTMDAVNAIKGDGAKKYQHYTYQSDYRLKSDSSNDPNN